MKYYPINPEFLAAQKLLHITYKKFLSIEMGYTLSGNFFKFQNNFYPIKIKFFIAETENQEIKLGNFNSFNLMISINYYYYQFLNSEEQLNLLRHEFAHYLAYILKGEMALSHDSYFRQLCQSFGWGKNVYDATVDITILEKIKKVQKNSKKAVKLLALANNNTSWQEAQSALLKAKELMNQELDLNQFVYVAVELHSGKRLNSKLRTITQLLENFSCKTIFLTTPGTFTLEVICKIQDMENIVDLFNFFNQQIDAWFLESKKYNPKIHRGSFYQGLCLGLKQKFSENSPQTFEHQKSLVLIDQENLQNHFELLYPRTSSSYTKARNDRLSFNQGIILGKRLELKNKIKNTLRFLT